MLTPLYSILPETITVTVAAPGAAADDVIVPVAPLSGGIPSGTNLHFGPGLVAVLAGDAAEDDVSLDVEPLAFDLAADDEASYAPPNGNALLSQRWSELPSDAHRTAEHIRAELALGLTAGYTGTNAEELAFAIVLQINFQLARGITPDIQRSVASNTGGASTTEMYRDRNVSPEAAAIVARVTGARQVRFTPVTAGV